MAKINNELSKKNLEKLFVGYIPVNDKKPAVPSFTDPTYHYTYEQAEKMHAYSGVLREDAVLLDVDDKNDGKLILKIIEDFGVECRVHETTKGYHFLFIGHGVEKAYTGVVTAIGLGWIKDENGKICGKTDYKLGSANGLVCLKYQGVEREVVYETENIGPMPKWLLPIFEGNESKSNPKVHESLFNFKNAVDGDGRDPMLFSYRGTLKNRGFTYNEMVETCDIINRYVFADPMKADQFATVTRVGDYDAIKPSFKNKSGKFQHNLLGDYLLETMDIIMLDGNLHVYENGVYILGENEIEDEMRELMPELVDSQVSNVMKYIISRARRQCKSNPVKRAPANRIVFQNGTFDTDTGLLGPHDPTEIVVNPIHWNYNPNAECEIVDHTLDKISCHNPQLRALLEEMIGYCFYRENSSVGKAFVLLGDQNNGKSTYLKVIKRILGTENISNLSIQKLDGRFDTATLFNKLANINEDIPPTYVDKSDVFKQIVTGDTLQVEMKNKDPFTFVPYCKLIFAANNMPRMEDSTGAVTKRLIPIPFDAKFSRDDEDYDPNIGKKLQTDEAIERFIKLGVDGLMRYLENGEQFTIIPEIEEKLDEIDRTNNPMLVFMEDIGGIDAIDGRSTSEVYLDMYVPWAIENGLEHKKLGKQSFCTQAYKVFGAKAVRKTICGKVEKCFAKK